jgi:hypothetical protein
MLRPYRWHPVRRILVGAAGGAALGFVLPHVLGENAQALAVRIAFTVIMAALGASAFAFLSATGWAMLAGGLVGSVAAGLLGVLATLHLKGVIYSFLGAPVGAIWVLLHRLGREGRKPPDTAVASPARPGVWDAELDR